jgi:hypothetical protein
MVHRQAAEMSRGGAFFNSQKGMVLARLTLPRNRPLKALRQRAGRRGPTIGRGRGAARCALAAIPFIQHQIADL